MSIMTCAPIYVIYDAKLQLHNVGRKLTERLYMANEKRIGRIRLISYSDFIDFFLLSFAVSRHSRPPPFSSSLSLPPLCLFLSLLISRLKDCLEWAIRRVGWGETRTLVTGSLEWTEGINEDGDARPGRRCPAMRRDALRDACLATRKHSSSRKKGELKSREIENPYTRIH